MAPDLDLTQPGPADPERPTIQQQIDEVQCCLLSIRAAVDAWRRAPEKHRGVETGCCKSKIEPLEAAVRTLEWMRDHEDDLRALLARKQGRAA